MDLRKTINQLNSQLNHTYDNGMERVLDRLGLETKRDTTDYIMPSLGIFSAGLVVGAALGLLFAPKRGNEVRSEIRGRLDDLRTRGAERYEELRAHQLDNNHG